MMQKTGKPKHMVQMVSAMILLLIFISCSGTKNIQEPPRDNAYLLKQLHMEPRNSSYNDLIADFLEDNKSWQTKEKEAFLRDTMVHIEKTACVGSCPVFHFTVFNNGKAKFDGVDNIFPLGIYEGTLDEGQKTMLQFKMNQIQLLKMYPRYPRGVKLSANVPATKFVISNGEFKFKTIITYGQPQELKDLEAYMEKLIADIDWIQI